MAERIEGLAEKTERIREILCHILRTKVMAGERHTVSSREIYASPFIDWNQDTINAVLDTLVSVGEWIELKGRIFVEPVTISVDIYQR